MADQPPSYEDRRRNMELPVSSDGLKRHFWYIEEALDTNIFLLEDPSNPVGPRDPYAYQTPEGTRWHAVSQESLTKPEILSIHVNILDLYNYPSDWVTELHRHANPDMGGTKDYRRRLGLIDQAGKFFEPSKPQYPDRTVGDFVHVKDFGARVVGKILFVDSGSYILRRTVTVPLGSRLARKAWPQLVAWGPFFEDDRKPQVMRKVGKQGDVGNIELQDLIFTNRGPTAGLIAVEWSVQAEKPGSAAYGVPISVYAARGLLVESRHPIWLYGTASEHSSMYQYKFNEARNVYADGTWETTEPSLTVSHWAFEVLTITQDGKKVRKRNPSGNIIRKIAEISWPDAIYTGEDGKKSTTAPEAPVPLSTLNSETSPPEGDWPPDSVEAILGEEGFPVDDECFKGDLTSFGPADDPPADGEDGNEDIRVPCPEPETTTISEPTTTTTEDEDWTPTWEPEPEPSPFENGDASINEVKCNSDGRESSHERIDNAIKSYCNILAEEGDVLKEGLEKKREYPFPIINLETSAMEIAISFKIWEGCQWTFTWDECRKYLLAPINSFQCGGKDGKRGRSVENNCYTWTIDPNSVS
ncbi:hypothetical protein FBEOM_1796 [Fusarium beomiforme]|uniref:Uncharacterized protein n=1 Tax=Fusarium beomiforme TaxID=44412 RepID=A0A9P5E0I6_9HYPO|nr:hypothetical protein FBEOM_1796 [Fusarium beomiforme]